MNVKIEYNDTLLVTNGDTNKEMKQVIVEIMEDPVTEDYIIDNIMTMAYTDYAKTYFVKLGLDYSEIFYDDFAHTKDKKKIEGLLDNSISTNIPTPSFCRIIMISLFNKKTNKATRIQKLFFSINDFIPHWTYGNEMDIDNTLLFPKFPEDRLLREDIIEIIKVAEKYSERGNFTAIGILSNKAMDLQGIHYETGN